MQILIDLTSLADNFSGIERFALSVTKEMIKETSYQFILVFKNKVHKEFQHCEKNVTLKVINGKNKLITAQITLPLFLVKQQADVYFFPAFPAPFLLFNKKSVSTIHDLGCWDCPSTDKKYMSLYFRILYKKASANDKKVVTVSNFSASRIKDILKVKDENICVAYNGLSELFLCADHDRDVQNAVRKKYDLPQNYILCLSTVEPRKNLRLLIDAYCSLIEDEKMDINLVLAGRKGWKVDHLMEGISERCANKIHFTGFIDDVDLPYIYQLADIFVFPSVYEGFGIPPLEALSQGTPVLSSDSTSLPEVLGDSALYFKNNSLEDLIKKLRVMIDESSDRVTSDIDGIIKKYNWMDSAKKILDFMK